MASDTNETLAITDGPSVLGLEHALFSEETRPVRFTVESPDGTRFVFRVIVWSAGRTSRPDGDWELTGNVNLSEYGQPGFHRMRATYSTRKRTGIMETTEFRSDHCA